MAEHGVVLLDEAVISRNPLIRRELDEIVEEEQARLLSYQATFHPHSPPDLTGKSVLLVDDGLATGATTEAAVLSVRKQNARNIVVAAARGFNQRC